MKEMLKRYLHSLATDSTCGLVSSCLKSILYILSLLYGLGVKTILACYRLGIFKRCGLDANVISVGNMTLGGTGKTPVVEMVASILQNDKQKVAILSRGYGRKIQNSLTCREIQPGQAKFPGLPKNSARAGKIPRPAEKFSQGRQNKEMEGVPGTVYQVGDEPLLLSSHLPEIPILVGKDRLKNGQEAIARYGVNAILLDDGFQHWRLKKDLEIVVIDSTNPFGNGKCLPRGILREPISGLKRADVVVLTKTDLQSQPPCLSAQVSRKNKKKIISDSGTEDLKATLNKINPGVLIVESVHQPEHFRDLVSQKILDLSCISGQKIFCLSSIGDPAHFERTILRLGARVCFKSRFPDHYRYTSQDLEKIYRACHKEAIETVVTTEKDAVRIKPLMSNAGQFFELKILVLVVQIRITKNFEKFMGRLLNLHPTS